MIETRLVPAVRHFTLCFLAFLLFVGTAVAHGTKDKGLISPADLASAGTKYQVLDIRSGDDFARGHVPGALSLPVAELSESRLQNLGIAPGSPVVLVGVSESSAGKAKLLLDILGYSNIRILAGSYTHWVEDGHAVENGSLQPMPQAQDKPPTAVLTIIPEVRDLGEIKKKNGVVTTIFQLRNSSPVEITITGISTSCGCTTAEVQREAIPPGEETTLSVHFDPNFHKEPVGKFSRTVFLQTSSNREIQAKLTVEIVP